MAYKINSNIKVTLESPDGNAVLVFKKGKINQMLASIKEAEAETDPYERTKKRFKNVVDKLVSVDPMEDDEGPLTIERMQALDLDLDVMNAIVEGYNLAMGFTGKATDPEKKDSSPA
jgi:hypothetical protein